MNSTDAQKHVMLDVLQNRWSPKTFDPEKSLSEEEVALLFEAARWAPSSYNAQPWRYAYALRGEEGFDKMVETLAPPNQAWAKHASMLILGIAKTGFENREGQNRFAFYDLGAANMALINQASSMSLSVRQMGGYSQKKAIELLNLGEGYAPAAYIAVGYLDPSASTEAKDRRRRVSLEKLVDHFKG